MVGKRSQPSPVGSPLSDSSSKDQDRYLPIANVGRIMKKSLPSNAKISKEAKEMVQECVSEFISFITGEACEKCQREKRKTINGDDLLWAMTNLGFENYVGTLKVYLNKYREIEGDKNIMAMEEDQPISNSDHKFHNGENEINKNVNNNYEFDSSFGVQVSTKGYGEDHLVNNGFSLGKNYEHGNPHLHHGVEW